jgi:hypothetical protein
MFRIHGHDNPVKHSAAQRNYPERGERTLIEQLSAMQAEAPRRVKPGEAA